MLLADFWRKIKSNRKNQVFLGLFIVSSIILNHYLMREFFGLYSLQVAIIFWLILLGLPVFIASKLAKLLRRFSERVF
ncbi:hypothetical protein COT52_03195 [candidate division WWE3 bacterium CG08_land_8_20_14_0_20_43_13]|uniref:Uncharacterized protein n=1 Tax=candidate division WWE3 bacterium CG08_land_8_20_14_0_20_43_13 TaxID=1975087 RepID=A0A2H0X6T3_UNCKA|nr:MAG: hypothetical protein COT52_03195 [candidate division WWE3 bacterium CG08_land_8_20_14_0_20_43_13]